MPIIGAKTAIVNLMRAAVNSKDLNLESTHYK